MTRTEAEAKARDLGHELGPWVWCGCEPDCRRYEAACTSCGHSAVQRRGAVSGGDALYYRCDGVKGRQRRAEEFRAFVARQEGA